MDASNWLKIAKELEHKVIHHLDKKNKKFFKWPGRH